MWPQKIKRIISVATICLLFVALALLRSVSERMEKANNHKDIVNISSEQSQNKSISDSLKIKQTPYIDPSFFSKIEKLFPKTETIKKESSENNISAKSYIAGDVSTGKILIEKNAKIAMPVASMSKILTAAVALDLIPSETETSIEESYIKDLPNNQDTFKVGEVFKINELLLPMLVSSSNIAAEAIASTTYMKRVDFLENMSSYSWELGLKSSFFADASGISELNHVSAQDLFSLGQYLYKRRPEILRMTMNNGGNILKTQNHEAHQYTSTHPYVNDPRFLGGKTGTTDLAGETMMTILNIRENPIAIIVLHSEKGKRKSDTDKILSLIENKF